eukprot:2172249-Amphidinium_carterae.1
MEGSTEIVPQLCPGTDALACRGRGGHSACPPRGSIWNLEWPCIPIPCQEDSTSRCVPCATLRSHTPTQNTRSLRQIHEHTRSRTTLSEGTHLPPSCQDCTKPVTKAEITCRHQRLVLTGLCRKQKQSSPTSQNGKLHFRNGESKAFDNQNLRWGVRARCTHHQVDTEQTLCILLC